MGRVLSDGLDRLLPWWVRNRPQFKRGYNVVRAFAEVCDDQIDDLIEGIQSAWPGRGTPTALSQIGATRGIVRGLSDTDDDYAGRERGWLDRYPRMGSDEAIARELHEYLRSRPMIRVVDRHGQWTEINASGVLRTFTAAWDWDSISHPTAATDRPTDIWIIIYASYAHQPNWAALDGSHGIGHTSLPNEREQAISIIKQWKPAHNFVRCVIFADSPSALNPEASVGIPDGRWGYWGKDDGSGGRVKARSTAFRYWEFDQ